MMEIFFDLDIIDDWIEKYDVKGSCMCIWVEMDLDDCCCGLVVIEFWVRQDVYIIFMEVGNDLFLKDVLVVVWVIVGWVWMLFEILNCYILYDYFCDNFRVYFQMFFVNDFFIFFDVFFIFDKKFKQLLMKKFIN